MIWIPDTQDKNAQHFTDEGVVHGTVRYMPKTQKYMATTNHLYLGQYLTLLNAQKAVEAKHDVEVKVGIKWKLK